MDKLEEDLHKKHPNNPLLVKLKLKNISVCQVARLLDVKKRTMQMMFDNNFKNHPDKEEKVNVILSHQEELIEKLK